MTLEEIEVKLCKNNRQKTVQVYFTKEFTKKSGLHDINITSDNVNDIMVDNGFLKIHDAAEGCWHYHVPDGWRNK